VLVGTRRTGKTVLLKEITKNFTEPILMPNGEDYRTAELFRNKGIVEYKKLLGNKRFLIIDEAQKVEGIGRILKLMVDEIEDLKILVTGSSAFDLNNKLGEPLTGRKHTVKLYPVAQCEWENYDLPGFRSLHYFHLF
jgi:predicted AAA+ superfamily ATPase